MFSGQGSHYYQMGRELFESDPVFSYWMNKQDQVVHDLSGASVISVLYDDAKRKSDPFFRTVDTHPAIFMVEYALARMLTDRGVEPDYVLGASMGEFTAAALAEVMSVEDIIAALLKQAEVLETHCPPGGMTAILDTPELFYDTPLLYEQSEFCGQNYKEHFVISGIRDGLSEIEGFLREHEIVFQSLPVSQAFHSRWIESAASMYKNYLRQYTRHPSRIPIISCAEAALLKAIQNDHLWDVVRKPIAFQQTVRDLECGKRYVYIDVGPSGTLANFVKQNLSEISKSQVFHILSPFGPHDRNLSTLEKLFRKKCTNIPVFTNHHAALKKVKK